MEPQKKTNLSDKIIKPENKSITQFEHLLKVEDVREAVKELKKRIPENIIIRENQMEDLFLLIDEIFGEEFTK